MPFVRIVVLAVLLAPVTAFAQSQDPATHHVVSLHPFSAGQWVEKVSGDFTKPGEPFVFRIHQQPDHSVLDSKVEWRAILGSAAIVEEALTCSLCAPGSLTWHATDSAADRGRAAADPWRQRTLNRLCGYAPHNRWGETPTDTQTPPHRRLQPTASGATLRNRG